MRDMKNYGRTWRERHANLVYIGKQAVGLGILGALFYVLLILSFSI